PRGSGAATRAAAQGGALARPPALLRRRRRDAHPRLRPRRGRRPCRRGPRPVSERIVTADACVIGTGAGGAPVAALLAEAGWRVAILEEGDVHEPAAMNARPRDMMPRLYRDGGQI